MDVTGIMGMVLDAAVAGFAAGGFLVGSFVGNIGATGWR